MAKMTPSKIGSTDTPMGKMSGTGSGMTKRDSATNTSSNMGGKTTKLRSGQVSRSLGNFSSYGKIKK